MQNPRQSPKLTPEQSERLAEALIGDVFADALAKQQAVVAHCRDELRRAERVLGEISHARADWTRHHEVDYSFGEQIVMQAKLADFAAVATPPGEHARAVASYFQTHPPAIALKRLAAPRRGRRRTLRHR